jgi:hypothetical protein
VRLGRYVSRPGIGRALNSWQREQAFARGATLALLIPIGGAWARLFTRLGLFKTASLDAYCDRCMTEWRSSCGRDRLHTYIGGERDRSGASVAFEPNCPFPDTFRKRQRLR